MLLMNIFYLDTDPQLAASYHCDKHIVKMIVEYSQLLSTAHRVLDGVETDGKFKNLLIGEKVKSKYDNDKQEWVKYIENQQCYKQTHINHPSAIWARESIENYYWLFNLLRACHAEYTLRYKKQHKSLEIIKFLSFAPRNIHKGSITPMALAMPDEFKVDDAVQSYRNFYLGPKAKFAKWNFTQTPTWFKGQ